MIGSIDKYFFGNPEAMKAAKSGAGAPKPRAQRQSIGLPKRSSGVQEIPMGEWDGRFADVKNRGELFETKERSGERFTGLKSVVPLKKSSLLGGREEKVPAVIIFSKTGISVLTFAEDHGFIESHPWPSIRSFGASNTDCFGIQVKGQSGEEVFVCCYSEQSGNTMDTLASKYAKANESLELMTERDRATTKGVEVVASQGLIQLDIASFEHVPVQREKQSGKSGNQFQDGFLVVGIAAVTFLDKTKSLVSSHPLSHVDMYFTDGDKSFVYNVHTRNTTKKGQKVKFAFVTQSAERANFLLQSMDKYIFENRVFAFCCLLLFVVVWFLNDVFFRILLPCLCLLLLLLPEECPLACLLASDRDDLAKCRATTGWLLGTACFVLSAEAKLLRARDWRECGLLASAAPCRAC
jgi:hypothetical protein